MARGSYGFDSGTDVDWRLRGACTGGGYPIDWWKSADVTERGRAVWVCRNRCPVRLTCHRWADAHRPLVEDSVLGGVLWTRGKGGVRPAPTQPASRSPFEQPAGQARLKPYLDEIRMLVAAGVSNTDIAARFGSTAAGVRNFLSRERIWRTGGSSG
jgi:hypothetical protein